jgi:UDP-N-acetylenolpyruvoylglucosamine reductase
LIKEDMPLFLVGPGITNIGVRISTAFVESTVHDEIIVEASEAKAEQVKKLLAKIMVNVFDKLFKKQVPIEVEAKDLRKLGRE